MSQLLPAVNARQVLAALRARRVRRGPDCRRHHVLVHPGDARRTVGNLLAVDFASAEHLNQMAVMIMVA
jgi:hypothetical protein